MPDRPDVGFAEKIAGGNAEKVALLPALERTLLIAEPVAKIESRGGRLDEFAPRAGGEDVGIGEPGDEIGVVLERLAEKSARSCQLTHRLGCRRGVAERLDQRTGMLWAIEQIPDDEEAEIGIG